MPQIDVDDETLMDLLVLRTWRRVYPEHTQFVNLLTGFGSTLRSNDPLGDLRKDYMLGDQPGAVAGQELHRRDEERKGLAPTPGTSERLARIAVDKRLKYIGSQSQLEYDNPGTGTGGPGGTNKHI